MRSLLAMLLFAAAASAAPVPKEQKEAVEAKFGKIVDPKGDTDFKMDGKTLVVTLPGKQTRSYAVDQNAETGKFEVKNNAVEIKLPETKGEFEIAFTLTAKRSAELKKTDRCKLGAGLLIRDYNGLKGDEKALLAFPVDDFHRREVEVSPGISNLEYSPNRKIFGGFDVGSRMEKDETVLESWKVVYRFDKRGLEILLESTSKGMKIPLALREDRGEILAVPVNASLIFVHDSPEKGEVRIDDFRITDIAKKK